VNLAERLTPSPDVVTREVGGETILLDLANGNYFGLDGVGSRLWQLLEERGCTLGEACDVLIEEYEVDRARLEADLLALGARLVDENLATPAP
jgi:hypothetical protein